MFIIYLPPISCPYLPSRLSINTYLCPSCTFESPCPPRTYVSSSVIYVSNLSLLNPSPVSVHTYVCTEVLSPLRPPPGDTRRGPDTFWAVTARAVGRSPHALPCTEHPTTQERPAPHADRGAGQAPAPRVSRGETLTFSTSPGADADSVATRVALLRRGGSPCPQAPCSPPSGQFCRWTSDEGRQESPGETLAGSDLKELCAAKQRPARHVHHGLLMGLEPVFLTRRCHVWIPGPGAGEGARGKLIRKVEVCVFHGR